MCACVPPPPRRIARRSPKMRVKQRWMGFSDTPTLAARVSAPPCAKTVKKTEILRRIFSFSYTRVRQCSPIGYMIGKIIIAIWNIINIGFSSLMKIYVLRICNVQ